MIFTIPLDSDTHKINTSVSTSQNNIEAMHIKSKQSVHFTGNMPVTLYPLVFTNTAKGHRLWHGKSFEFNVIETKGNQNKIDALVFGETDIRFLLINKDILEMHLSKVYGTKDLKSHYAYKAYKIEDIDIERFIDIHSRILKNEKVSDEEISLLILQIFKKPITEQLSPDKGYELIQKSISLMKYHLKDPLLIRELCEILDVSTRTLELAFNKHLNITPKLYYKRLLLLVIETELRNTEEKTVSNVVNEYKIYNLSTFGASFKNYFSKTPSEVLALDDKENPLGWNEKIFLEFSED